MSRPIAMGGISLSIDPTEAGMSGSPMLNDAGRAIGVASVGAETISAGGERKNERAGPQPILTRNLPGWLLSEV
jgi:V8-like Glu-specific endopeptidase